MNKAPKILLMALVPFLSLAAKCPDQLIETSGSWRTHYECRDANLFAAKEYYIKTGAHTGSDRFDSQGRIIIEDSWSVDGIHTFHATYQYLDNGHFIKEQFRTNGELAGKLEAKQELAGDFDDPIILKDWVISQSSLKQQGIRHYREDEYKPYRIDVLSNDGKILKYYEVKYNLDAPMANLVTEFKAYTPEGLKIGEYHENGDFDVASQLKKFNLSQDEYKRRLAVFNNKDREPVVIIDTGFDIMHPELTHKLYNSPYDNPNDGIDNDGNGRVDDSWGWQRQDDAGLSLLRDDRNIRETHSLVHTPYPVSHGTHVASLALRDLDNYGLVGFAGDVAISDHLQKAGEYISNKKVKFVNMSFAIGFPGAPMSAPRDSFHFLEKVFTDNPDTLFIVAAGNARGDLDLDQKGNDNFPASYTYENMIKVGALNTATLEEGKYDTYRPASFSKYGKKKVQIFAPGTGVLAAQSGGGEIALNGTSMAAPFVTNVILKAHAINPKLTPMELKKIIMDTAYIPSSGKLPCESGGIINPEAIYQAVEALK